MAAAAALTLALLAAFACCPPAEATVAEIGPTVSCGSAVLHDCSPWLLMVATRRLMRCRSGPAWAADPLVRPIGVQLEVLPRASTLIPTQTVLPTVLPAQIYIGGIQDLQLDGSGISKCNRLVDAALSYGAFSNAQFLVSGACSDLCCPLDMQQCLKPLPNMWNWCRGQP